MFSPISRRSRCDELDQHVGNIEDPRLQRLLARERQQLAHQIGGAVGVLLDLHDVGKGRVARPRTQQQQVAKADHRGQQIVEIMRDPAGELADRLHLLRLHELSFETFLLGDVDQVQHQAAAVGVGVAARRNCHGARFGGVPRTGRQCRAFPFLIIFFIVEPAQQQDEGPFARAVQADFDRLGINRSVRRRGEPRGDRGTLGLGQKTGELGAAQLLGRDAEQFARRAVRLDEPAQPIDHGDADRGVGKQPLKGFAGWARGRCWLLAGEPGIVRSVAKRRRGGGIARAAEPIDPGR